SDRRFSGRATRRASPAARGARAAGGRRKRDSFDPNEWKTLLRFYEKDPAFGYKLRPRARATVTKLNGSTLVYKAVYTTDEHGRRVMPAPDGPVPERAVFFLGCSYTFGWGVDDAETMPWKTAELAPYRRVYNFGVGGYGPQQLVELFKTDLSKEVPQKRALAIFTFHHEHINRAAGTPRVVRTFGGDFPWYALDEHTGRPARKGSFRERPNAPANSGSKLLDAMRDYHGEVLTKDDARLAALLIDEARVLFEKRFASDGFYLLLYPARQDKLTDEVVRIVQANGVKVLDYRHLLNAGGAPDGPVDYDRWFFPGDGHPNRDLHAKMAAKIVQDLGLER
ncbi:MAG: hypothetical protein KIS92_26725, partial [Planctomycetota bacterium]|nr:hypothetical protein [Planctomycetota bacterium]